MAKAAAADSSGRGIIISRAWHRQFYPRLTEAMVWNARDGSKS